MPKLPIVSYKEVLKVTTKLGWEFKQQKGSHIVLGKTKNPPLTVPKHKKLKKGTLKQIIRILDLTNEEFINHL